MSIFAYTGLPGSGKTHTVVEHQILPALKAGRRVVTNVPLHLDVVRADFPAAEVVELPLEAVQAAPESIYDYVTPGSVLVLDEVWRIFPAGLKANHVPEPFRKLLAEHRHMVNAKGESTQVVLVTQDLAQIAAFARQLIEQTFRTVKLSTVGLSKQYRLDVYHGPISGPNPPQQQRLREIFGRYHAGVWKYYKSHTMSEAKASGANEAPIDKRGNILRAPAFVIGAAIVILGAIWVMPKLGRMFDKDASLLGAEKVAPAGTVAAGAPEARPAHPAAGSIIPTSSSQPSRLTSAPQQSYRIAAVVLVHGDEQRSRVMITDEQRIYTLPFVKNCYRTPDGRTFCQFRGVEVGEFGLVDRASRI